MNDKYRNLDNWRPDPPAHAEQSQRMIHRQIQAHNAKPHIKQILFVLFLVLVFVFLPVILDL